MDAVFRFPSAVREDPAVETWFEASFDGSRLFARPWFDQMRACGEDVRELIHDGCPTACAEEAAFGYVNAFKGHVNVGFYFGADLDDPACLLQGAGKRMRHVKLPWDQQVDAAALGDLITAAYRDIRARSISGQ